MHKKLIRKIAQVLGIILALGTVALVVTSLAILFRIHLSNDWEEYVHIPKAKPPEKNQKIIVFAPHCDDESLGCAGIIALAKKNGAQVKLVLVTNGDGFKIAVASEYKTIRVTHEKCIKLAYHRQIETQNAMAVLGVSKKDIAFLSYPDRGVAKLWNTYWNKSRLYTSDATGWDRARYKDAYTKNAPYCGESLLNDIKSIIEKEKPTDIYMPHPSDNHPDHYATYCFVAAAIEQIRAKRAGFVNNINKHTYIVHRGDWPSSDVDSPNYPTLSPPSGLTRGDTNWQALSLPSDIIELKKKAISRYRSQTRVAKGFLNRFICKNEIFGSIPQKTIKIVKDRDIQIDGMPSDWISIPPSLMDPVGDYLVAGLRKNGDVRAVYLCRSNNYLYIRIDMAGRVAGNVKYSLELKSIKNNSQSKYYKYEMTPGKKYSEQELPCSYNGNMIEMAVPNKDIGTGTDVFVKVTTRSLKFLVDDTGWHGFSESPDKQIQPLLIQNIKNDKLK